MSFTFIFDFGLSRTRGYCTIINDSIINVNGKDYNIKAIKSIRAHSSVRNGERIFGGIMLTAVPLWIYIATWTIQYGPLCMVGIGVPAVTLAIMTGGYGLYYLISKTTKHEYDLQFKWDLKIVKDFIPLDINREY